jgi:hypothetical protein
MPSAEDFKIWSEIAQNISVTGAAVVTAYYGAKGLSAWRRELSGRAGFETARKVLKTLYEIRDTMLGFLDTLDTSWMKYESKRDQLWVVHGKLRELESLSHEVEITFGKNIRKVGLSLWALAAACDQMFLESTDNISQENLSRYLKNPPRDYIINGVHDIENAFVRHAR